MEFYGELKFAAFAKGEKSKAEITAAASSDYAHTLKQNFGQK